MRLLLDTHIAVWIVTNDPRLSQRARELLAEATGGVYVSVVSLWEIATKFALGRPGDPMPFSAEEALRWFDDSGFGSLSVEPRHAVAVDHLPPHHRDPFDRILIAQAISEPMRLLTRDARLPQYSPLVERV